MQCPKCDGDMEMVHNAEVRIDRCNQCNGLYFDQLTRGDIGYVEGQVGLDTGDEETGAEYNEMVYVECPKCDKIMDQRLVDEPVRIRFEICTSCHSTFLDAGEFRQYLSGEYRDYFISELPEG